jgi:HAD superfamily phosphoserine phosphatase-like hydrolase
MTDAKPTLLAIYDMDKTVTRRATYNGFLLHMAFNKAPWRFFLAPLLPIGLALYALKLWDRARLKQFSQTLLIGHRVPTARFAKYLESHADIVVGKNVYPQLLARVAEEKAAGYRHVMATASYRLYVEAIAKRLGFDDIIATDLATDSTGHVLARIDGHNCYDAAKLDRVKGSIKLVSRVSGSIRYAITVAPTQIATYQKNPVSLPVLLNHKATYSSVPANMVFPTA